VFDSQLIVICSSGFLLEHIKVLNKVTHETPAPILVDAYVSEIARGYGIEWTPVEQAPTLSAGDAPPQLDFDEFEDVEPEACVSLTTPIIHYPLRCCVLPSYP
jgi:hypothetical protein